GRARGRGRRYGSLPAFAGPRPKPFAGAAARGALRTLERVGAQLSGEPIPGFALTAPKLVLPIEVELLRRSAEALEHRLGWPGGAVAPELMVETPSALISLGGRLGILARGRGARGLGPWVRAGPHG